MRGLWFDSAQSLGSQSTGLGNMVREPRAGFHIAEWGVFYHTARPRNRPTRLKLVLSDRKSKDRQIRLSMHKMNICSVNALKS